MKKRHLVITIFLICIMVLTVGFKQTARASATAGNDAGKYVKTDIAQIFITTENTIEKTDYVAVTIAIVDAEGGSHKTILDTAATIKIRGNSTSSLNKKPYNFKLSSSQSVLGMAKGKKWSLLANYLDTSLMRNKLAYDLCEKIGLAYSCDSQYVDVWLNGKYIGNYLLAVPIDTGENRINIDTEAGDYLLELDRSKVEEGVTYINTSMNRLAVEETVTKDQEKWLIHYFKEIEEEMREGDYEEITELVDVESFIDYYIVQELFKNKDVNNNSTRFYIKEGILYAGPFWDCDLSAGNVSEYESYNDHKIYHNSDEYGDGSGLSYQGFWALGCAGSRSGVDTWIGLLMKNGDFRSSLYKRYEELQGTITNLYEDNTIGTNKIDSLLNINGASFLRDNKKWPVKSYRGSELYLKSGETFDETVSYLKSWLEDRNEWLLTNLKLKQYKVTLKPNGGSVKTINKIVFTDCYYGELPTASRKNYTFLGWYTKVKGGTKVTETNIFTLKKNQTLYAHWKKF